MHKPWIYLNNPFIVATRINYKKAYELSVFTHAVLKAKQADPFFGPLYTAYHPLHETLVAEYVDWESQKGIQKGSTLKLDQLLLDLGFGTKALGIPSKISEWNLAVQLVFHKNTAAYKAIFPNGRRPFQNGDKNSRISAVEVLSLALAPHPALAATKALVDAFYTSLNDARREQQGKLSETGTDSNEVKKAITAAMTGLYAVLGACIHQFADRPSRIEAFFNLQLLRDLQQMKWTGTVKPTGMKNIFKRTLEPSRRIKITVLSDKDLKFAVAEEKNDSVIGGVVVRGLEDEIVEWRQLKQGKAASFFKVIDEDADVEGHFTVEILPERNNGEMDFD